MPSLSPCIYCNSPSSPPAAQFAVDWDYFGAQFESAFTRWPLAVGMGNHERDYLNEPNPTDVSSGK